MSLKTKITLELDVETADRLDCLAAKLTRLSEAAGVPVELEGAAVRALKRGLDALDEEVVVRDPRTDADRNGLDRLRPSRRSDSR